MSKAKKPRQKDAIKRAAEKREQHVRLVASRAGDESFVQRQRQPDGSITVTIPAERSGDLREALEAQRVAFREKFGREMGPEDPIFFDPNADTPQPYTEASMHEMQEGMVQAARDAGIDPAFILAGNEVGYLPTEATLHLFTAHELEAYEEAVRRHQETAGQD